MNTALFRVLQLVFESYATFIDRDSGDLGRYLDKKAESGKEEVNQNSWKDRSKQAKSTVYYYCEFRLASAFPLPVFPPRCELGLRMVSQDFPILIIHSIIRSYVRDGKMS